MPAPHMGKVRMIRLDFNYDAIFRRLESLGDRLDDLTPAYQEIGEYVVDVTKQRFLEGRAPDGSAWAPKKPSTIARYLARGDGNRPDPLIGPSGRLGREVAALPSRDSVEIGSALEYSAVMQNGAAKGAFGNDAQGRPLPWGDIPARVWLGLSDEDERNIIDIVEEHLNGEFG